MSEILVIFVMIRMLLLFTVVGLPTTPRDVALNMSRTETNLYEEYQLHTEKPPLCADKRYESFVIEPDLRGDLVLSVSNIEDLMPYS